MRWMMIVAFLGLGTPASAQTNDAALERVSEALRYEYQVSYMASAMFYCNLRDANWRTHVIRASQRESSRAYEAERASLPAERRSGFEREAWMLQAEYRRMLNSLIAQPTQSAAGCLRVRREAESIALLDRMAYAH